MKENIGKQINEFLTLDRYLKILGFSLILIGIVLFLHCASTIEYQYMLPTFIAQLHMTSNPLFYLIFGFSILLFRYFTKVTGLEIVEECE